MTCARSHLNSLTVYQENFVFFFISANQRSPGQSTKEKVQKGKISENKSFSDILQAQMRKRKILFLVTGVISCGKAGKRVQIFSGKI
jgi:hypothetical protein